MVFLRYGKPIWITAVLLSCLVVCLVWTFPVIQQAVKYVDLYKQVFTYGLPTITVNNGGLELQGDLPTTITINNNIKVVFCIDANEAMLKDAPLGSVVISESWILRKTAKGINWIGLKNIKVDHPLLLNPESIRQKIDTFLHLAVIVANVLTAILTILLLLVVVVFGAGVGSIIDAFAEGPFRFSDLMAISSVSLLLAILLAALASSYKLTAHHPVLPMLLTFLTVAIILTYGLIRLHRRQQGMNF
jgi:hypothetical protein